MAFSFVTVPPISKFLHYILIFTNLISDCFQVVKRMEKQPGGAKPNGFIPDSANHIKILSIKVLNQK